MSRNRSPVLPKLESVKKQYTLEELAAALINNNGRIYTTAKVLGISSQAIYERMGNHPELKAIVDDARGYLVDLAESTLETNIKNGDTSAAIWVTKTLGRNRGYAERLEVTGKDGGAIIFVWSDEDDNGGHETS